MNNEIGLLHEKLIPFLPPVQLENLYHYCGELRGKKWGHNDGVVDYVFEHSILCLVKYHFRVMTEMDFRRYYVNPKWKQIEYRGEKCKSLTNEEVNQEIEKTKAYVKDKILYPEHDELYLQKCIEYLKSDKSIIWRDCFINNDENKLCSGYNNEKCRRCYLYDNLMVDW